mmetsp:Transcript_39902/g.87094  ORF Transcript_39902/g.87094 Transcript_39902/m.87094 type:complete len:425 (-) Transcript_39902:175-1449(-)
MYCLVLLALAPVLTTASASQGYLSLDTAGHGRLLSSVPHGDLEGSSGEGAALPLNFLSSAADPAETYSKIELSEPSAVPLWDKIRLVVEALLSMKIVTSEVFPPPQQWHFDPSAPWLLHAPESEWAVLISTCVVVLCFDALVLQRLASNRLTNFCILGFWIAVAGAYNVYIFMRYGTEEGIDWCSGYLLEWLLSVDNIFVFHLVFKIYDTPPPLMHKALFVGIVGAIVFKLVFFFALGSLLYAVDWVRFVFGAILIYSGIVAVLEVDEAPKDLSEYLSVHTVKRMLGSRLVDHYDEEEHRLFVSVDGRLHATMLVLVILILEIADIIFAIDSVSAKVAQIHIQYAAYSSSVLAVFGLRAMFFVIHDLVDCFDLLKFGLCIILVFIGTELMFAQWLHLTAGTVCMVIGAVLMTCICGSLARRSKR